MVAVALKLERLFPGYPGRITYHYTYYSRPSYHPQSVRIRPLLWTLATAAVARALPQLPEREAIESLSYSENLLQVRTPFDLRSVLEARGRQRTCTLARAATTTIIAKGMAIDFPHVRMLR